MREKEMFLRTLGDAGGMYSTRSTLYSTVPVPVLYHRYQYCTVYGRTLCQTLCGGYFATASRITAFRRSSLAAPPKISASTICLSSNVLCPDGTRESVVEICLRINPMERKTIEQMNARATRNDIMVCFHFLYRKFRLRINLRRNATCFVRQNAS